MHHHLRSVASGRISTAIRQRVYGAPILRPRSSPFHVCASQCVPQPTPIRRQDEQRPGDTPPGDEFPAWTPTEEQQPSNEAQQGYNAPVERLNSTGEAVDAPPEPLTPGEKFLAALQANKQAGAYSQEGPNAQDEFKQFMEESRIESGGTTTLGFEAGRRPSPSDPRAYLKFIPKALTNKEDIFNLMRIDALYKPGTDIMNSWSIEDRFKYKMITRFTQYDNLEDLTERQKELAALVFQREKGDVVVEKAVSDPDMIMSLSYAIARRLCEDRMAGIQSTGAMIICQDYDRSVRFRSKIEPLANCYKVKTVLVTPKYKQDTRGEPTSEDMKERRGKPPSEMTYEEMVSQVEDVQCHILIITKEDFRRLMTFDSDARKLLNLVDWKTIVVDEASKFVSSSLTFPFCWFRKEVPPWGTRRTFFLDENVDAKVKVAAQQMVLRPVKTVQVTQGSTAEAVELAKRIPQSLLLLPSEGPEHLMPNLTALILRERAMHPDRFKAVVVCPSIAESQFFMEYYKRVQVQPALPTIYPLSEKQTIEPFRNVKEGMIFTYKVGSSSAEEAMRPFDDLTHIFHVNPLDGVEYIRALNLHDHSSATGNVPKAITVTFPFEYSAAFTRYEEVQAQSIQTETQPSKEDLTATSELDRMIRATAAAEAKQKSADLPEEENKEMKNQQGFPAPGEMYNDWLRRMAPYLSVWVHLNANGLVARANHLQKNLWGGGEQPPEIKATLADSLGLLSAPGLNIRNNMKQWKEQQVTTGKNSIADRHKHWRGLKEWKKKHEPKPIFAVKGLQMNPKF